MGIVTTPSVSFYKTLEVSVGNFFHATKLLEFPVMPFVASRPTRSTRLCPLLWPSVRCRLPAPTPWPGSPHDAPYAAVFPLPRRLVQRLFSLESRADSVSSRSSFSVDRRCPTYCERWCSIRQSLSLWPRDPAAFLPGALLHDREPALSSSPPSVSSRSLYSPPPTIRFHLAYAPAV
jgi:hypothetical protein